MKAELTTDSGKRKKASPELTRQEEFIRKHRRHHHEIASWRTLIFVLFIDRKSVV